MSYVGQSVQRAWRLVNAENQKVGRLASAIVPMLQGKNKPTFRPNGDCGDYVVVVNAEKVQFSGNKWKDKLYRWHTGYPGGLKQLTAKQMQKQKPQEILRKAILGMIKRNNLRHKYIEPRLKIYAGPNHPHGAQLNDIEVMPKVPRKIMGPI